MNKSLENSTSYKTIRKKRRTLSLADKIRIIEDREKYKQTFEELAHAYGADRSTISKIIKAKDVYLNAFEKHSQTSTENNDEYLNPCNILRLDHSEKYEPIENKLVEWLHNAQMNGTKITKNELLDEAYQIYQNIKHDHNYLAEKPMLNSWINNFIKKYNVECDEVNEKDSRSSEVNQIKNELFVESTDRKKHSNEILNCQYCEFQYDEPKILPCGNTICIKCIKVHLLDNDNITNEFKCFMCEEMHDFPKNKTFPTNQPLLKLLNQEINNNFNNFSQCEALNTFKTYVKNISKEKTNLESYLTHGVEKIQAHCMIVKTEIDLAVENSILNIQKIRENLVNELNAYENETIEFYKKNKIQPKEKMNLQALCQEIETFEENCDQYDLVKAVEIASDLKNKLNKKRIEIEKTLFNGSLIQFEPNVNDELESNQIGVFNFSNNTKEFLNNNHFEYNLESIDFEKLEKIDFNLNKLLEKKNPFQFRSNLNFQILDNGTYAISFRDSNDSLYYLTFFDGNFCLLKSLCLPLQSTGNGLRMFKYKNNIFISNSSNWCNRLIKIDENFELKYKDFEQNDGISWITANETYIFCLLYSSNINFHDWNLDLINSFFPSDDENLPFCVPNEINQLEIIDSKFVFKYENKIRIFDEDGRLLNEIVIYDDFLANHVKNQILAWNKEADKIFCYSTMGLFLSEISLLNFTNDNLNLYFDSLGNHLFVDLKKFFIFKCN